jgi:ATP-binding cassette subfamily B protein
MNRKTLILRLLQYAKKYTSQIVTTVVLMSIAVLIRMFEPFIIGKTLDQLIYQNTGFNQFLTYIYIFVGMIFIGNLINYVQSIFLQKTGQDILNDIRTDLFDHVIELDIDYYKKTKGGDTVSRITNDTAALNQMFTTLFTNLFINLLSIILSLSFMFYLQAKLTLIILAIVPVIYLVSFGLRKVMKIRHEKVRKYIGIMNGFLSEHLSGIKTIQLFNRQQDIVNKYEKLNNKLLGSFYKEIRIYGFYYQIMYFIQIASTIVILYYGGLSVINGTLTVGILFSFTAYMNRFFDPIHSLSNQMNIIESAFASANRIFETIDTKNKISNGEIQHHKYCGTIEFQNVWFSYDHENWILKNVSFTIKEHQSVAFVGPTGAGKSTIIALISRFYDVQKGVILIDGIPIQQLDKYELRDNIGLMLQQVFMFKGTVEDNLKLYDNTISETRMKEVGKNFYIESFINSNSLKYQQDVYEDGANFSMGEKQLLGFTRMLIKNPSILILDEATSNIDIDTEKIIQKALKKAMKNRTLVVVAHRLSTILNCNKIIVIKDGVLVEEGTHIDLIEKKGVYFELYNSQAITDLKSTRIESNGGVID